MTLLFRVGKNISLVQKKYKQSMLFIPSALTLLGRQLSDDAPCTGVEDAARDQMKDDLLAVDDEGMSSVVAALEASDDRG